MGFNSFDTYNFVNTAHSHEFLALIYSIQCYYSFYLLICTQKVCLRKMYQQPSDSVVDSIHEPNRKNISRLKKHLRECIGLKEIFFIHFSLILLDVKFIFLLHPSFPTTIYIYFQRRSTDETL